MRNLVCCICVTVLLSRAAAAEEHGARVDVLAKSGASWNGVPLRGYMKGTPEVTILRIQIPPGAQLPLHTHPVINAGVLIKGELTVVCEDSTKFHLSAGEAIVEVVDTWHYGKNEGDITAEIIVFYAGIRDTSITIKKP